MNSNTYTFISRNSLQLLLVLMLGTATATAQSPSGLVAVELGELPIILTAPHGGTQEIPDVSPRKGEGAPQFNARVDSRTRRLTESLADAIESELGKRPFVVIARFHRKYLDANRRPRDAMESPAAKDVYHAYHNAITDACQTVVKQWGYGILLDIHGQGKNANAIYRGTQNGKTTTHLTSRFGREALVGKTSLFGELANQGLTVIPAVGSNHPEAENYDGGYTVRTYGSGSGGTLDAIQLELGASFRSEINCSATANKLANAITAYAHSYLPKVPQYQPSAIQFAAPAQPAKRSQIVAMPDEEGCVVFHDDFSDVGTNEWFAVQADASRLSLVTRDGQLDTLPELNLATSSKSLQSVAAHFPAVTLRKSGEFIKLKFDARHNKTGFVDRGFRFGLFDSNQSKFTQDDQPANQSASLDDSGYFAIVDLGSSTSRDSAILRETSNVAEARLYTGRTIALDIHDRTRDPLMFTRNRSFTYTLTLMRNDDATVDVMLSNSVSGAESGLTGRSSVVQAPTLDTVYLGSYGTEADFAIDNVMIKTNCGSSERVSLTREADTRLRPEVHVGVYQDDGAGGSVKDLLFVLGKIDGVRIKRLTAEDIRGGQLDTLDVLFHPGGSGGGQGRHLGGVGREKIRNFVSAGGGFIGICAGSYLASTDYTWSLNILDAKVIDRKHWNRGSGPVELALTDSGRKLLNRDSSQLEILYAQGPLLAPADRPDIEDYEILATFETEVAKNGAPRGVMKGTTAIAKGQYGRGQVICFSPHPELTRGLAVLVREAIEHVLPTPPLFDTP